MTSPPNAAGGAPGDEPARGAESIRGEGHGPDPHPSRRAWHALPAADVAAALSTSLEQGLAETEAGARLVRVGQNKLAEAKRPSLFSRFIAQISDFTVLALLGAAAIAATLGLLGPLEPGQGLMERFGDSLAILAIVILNAGLGLVQE